MPDLNKYNARFYNIAHRVGLTVPFHDSSKVAKLNGPWYLIIKRLFFQIHGRKSDGFTVDVHIYRDRGSNWKSFDLPLDEEGEWYFANNPRYYGKDRFLEMRTFSLGQTATFKEAKDIIHQTLRRWNKSYTRELKGDL